MFLPVKHIAESILQNTHLTHDYSVQMKNSQQLVVTLRGSFRWSSSITMQFRWKALLTTHYAWEQ